MHDLIQEAPGLLEPYEGGEPYAFISYSHTKWDTVSKVIAQLQRMGCRIWYDRGIRSGELWRNRIKEKVRNCAVLLAFVSAEYVRSFWCKKELVDASESGKTVIGIYLEQLQKDGLVRDDELDAVNDILKDSQGFLNFPELRRETFYRELLHSPAVRPCLGAPMIGRSHLITETAIDTSTYCGHHIIISMDMMKFRYEDSLEEAVARAIREQPELQDMLPLTLEAEPLHFEEELRRISSRESFQTGYPFEHMFSLVVDQPLPTEDAERLSCYMQTFCGVMNELFRSLHSNGITDVHLFYRGPLALLPFVGQAMFNDFRIYYYQANRNGSRISYCRVGAQSRLL